MKKYLLLLGCACMALSAFANGTINTKVLSDYGYGIMDSVVVTLGGKPREKEKPRGTSNPDPVSYAMYSAGQVYLPNASTYSGKVIIATLIDQILTDACLASPSFDDTNIAKIQTADNLMEYVCRLVGGVVFNGGKPREKVRPRSVGDPDPVSYAMNSPEHSIGNDGGKVTIADVTMLIDQLLTGSQGEGKTIADVTKMIDQILIGDSNE